MTTQSTSDRLDRVERILEQIAEQIGQLVNNMNFLRTAVEGHLADPKAHSAD